MQPLQLAPHELLFRHRLGMLGSVNGTDEQTNWCLL